MALAKTIRFGEQYLLWGDGGSPEVFTPFCGFTSLNLTVNIETNSTNVPDCDDPDLPAWLVSDEVSKQMQLGGNGVIDTNVLDRLNDWILQGGERNFRWLTNSSKNPEANGYWEASGILSAYSQAGERGQMWTQDLTILLNGQPNRVDIPPAPNVTVRPSITGTPTVGQTLTAVDGTWTGTPAFTYQWLRDGAVISGGTAGTYLLAAPDEGANISVRVTGTNASGSFTSTSLPVGPVAP